MRASQLLGLVVAAMPLAAAMPAFTHAGLEQRGTLMSASQLAQFNFDPFNLTNIGMECARPNSTAEMYNCELRCECLPNNLRCDYQEQSANLDDLS